MLARLRREFIAITMLLVGLVLMGVLGMIFVSNAATLRSVTSRPDESPLRPSQSPSAPTMRRLPR